jgi:DNA (cytosine-5)-methyltransferase 1
MTVTCVDAFSGAGGLSLGLRRAGLDVLLSFDNDPLCIATQIKNPRHLSRSHKAVHASIQDMLHGRLLAMLGLAKGELSVLAGGPPCQGFSVQRIGEDEDHRNNLVLLFADLIAEVYPKLFLIENVPGILGKRGKDVLLKAVELAAEQGYWIHQVALDAADYGVPQRRRRVFIVGERMDLGLKRFRFPTAVTTNGLRLTVRNIIAHLPPPPEDGSDHPSLPNHRRDRLSSTNLKRLLALQPGQGREHLPDDLLAECHKRDASEIGHRGVYGRMAWDDVAPTITARFDSFTRGKFGHPEQSRTISLREGALLQTFPADYVFAGNKVDIARQIGNAVPPKLAELLGIEILRRLS